MNNTLPEGQIQRKLNESNQIATAAAAVAVKKVLARVNPTST
jgi:hypothetical protein